MFCFIKNELKINHAISRVCNLVFFVCFDVSVWHCVALFCLVVHKAYIQWKYVWLNLRNHAHKPRTAMFRCVQNENRKDSRMCECLCSEASKMTVCYVFKPFNCILSFYSILIAREDIFIDFFVNHYSLSIELYNEACWFK